MTKIYCGNLPSGEPSPSHPECPDRVLFSSVVSRFRLRSCYFVLKLANSWQASLSGTWRTSSSASARCGPCGSRGSPQGSVRIVACHHVSSASLDTEGHRELRSQMAAFSSTRRWWS